MYILSNFLRLANLLHVSNLSEKLFWDSLKKARLISYEKCEVYESVLYEKDMMKSQIEDLSKALNLNTSDDVNTGLTDSTLKTAAEMFLYLNSCPDDLRSWFVFYEDLLQKKPLEVILLQLNRILKGGYSHKNKKFKTIAKKIFERVTTLFSFKYKKIQNISQGLGDFTWNGGI